MGVDDFCYLAAELMSEHGADALAFAHRAVANFRSEGEGERAEFWFALSVFLDDIMNRRLDPGAAPVFH